MKRTSAKRRWWSFPPVAATNPKSSPPKARQIPVIPARGDAGGVDAPEVQRWPLPGARQDDDDLDGGECVGWGGLDPTMVIGGR